APRMYAHQALQLERLAAEENLRPAFPGSVFTTAEFSFANPSAVMTRTTGDQFGSWRAITTFGNYGDDSAWFLYWPEEEGDRFAVACPPGTTLVVPASIVRSSFSALKKGETRFIFQQYFNAAVGRWVENGFKSDSDFEGEASTSEWETSVIRRRYRRVDEVLGRLSDVNELFV
ncbi:hypothetical protein B0H14DRAFT_2400653, partial [Mycena olivaceomarginata]